MTQISPRNAQDVSDRFQRMYQVRARKIMWAVIIEILCFSGMLCMAGAAGYLYRDQEIAACVDPN
jgi:hypothetical protein